MDAHGVSNSTEAKLVTFIIQKLSARGVSENNIGIIAPYRAQVNLLKHTHVNSNLDINTVDQFQGKDKEVILYSCTRSKATVPNPDKPQLDILSDLRRLNVAITRAKSKLILIGNVDTLATYEQTFGRLLSYLKTKEQVIPILPLDLGVIV